MRIVPMEPFANKPSSEQPKGDLEYLFRQKFAEAEVPPRRNLWEQIDHELLVRQNEAYRRRIVQQRWLAAACILLVLVASTWAVRSSFVRDSPAVAVVAQPAASQGVARQQPEATSPQVANDDNALAQNGPMASAYALQEPLFTPRTAAAGTAAATENTLSTTSGEEASASAVFTPKFSLAPNLEASPAVAFNPALIFNSALSTGLSNSYLANRESTVGRSFARQASLGGQPTAFPVERSSSADLLADVTMARMANQLAAMMAGEAFGADTLRKASLLAAPEAVAVQAVTPEPEPQPRPSGRRWKLSAAVAAAAYNPNINFSRGNTSGMSYYNSGAAADAAGLRNASDATRYEVAAAEYRQHLEARPSMRARIGAARPLGRHWELATGVEFASQSASSQFEAVTTVYSPSSANAFTGSRTSAPALAAPTNGSGYSYYPPPTGTTSARYRYTSAGVPVAVRYGSAKTGWSLYATVGAAVNVLLGSKVETTGKNEGTQTYSLTSTDSPYRKVLGSVRGGAGARYRAADGQWSVLVGPEADLGLTTLNNDPAQSFFKRSRPYSVGLATSVEFGGAKSAVISH